MTENFKKKSEWIWPFLILLIISVIIFGINRIIDLILIKSGMNIFSVFFNEDVGNMTNTLGGLGELVSSVLGIEITVLAIIVQLAANKYSSKVMELFIEDRVNFVVISIYVVTAINTVLVSNTISNESVPYFSITICLLLIVISLLIVIPHFNYVFNFLRPNNFLAYVKDKILRNLKNLSEGKKKYSYSVKEEISDSINFIGDIALNSVIQGDRATTLQCLAILREITVKYLGLKKDLPANWFKMSGLEYFDPDFSSYSRFVMTVIENKKIFLERKVFRLFEMLFAYARVTLRDVASGVLLNSELIASGAVKANDKGALYCVFQYFNSYLRISIRERDPRSAFNTLEHYRILAEELLDEDPYEVENISFYFKYYGQEANKNQVLYIIETAAHDLCMINELAYEKKVPNIRNLLQMFLTVDEPLEEAPEDQPSVKEMSLIGVRIAQAKLAGFYLLKGDIELARIIYEDMKIEPYSRICKIQDMIFNTKDEEFWEITPRGINFNYVSPERREALLEFFSWFSKN